MSRGAKTSTPSTVFGKRLKEARTLAKLSQQRLGELARIDPSSSSSRINQYEKGVHWPDYSTAKRLAEVLKIPVSYLYTDDDALAITLLLIDKLSMRKKRLLIKSIKT